jgi:hypothetical protein
MNQTEVMKKAAALFAEWREGDEFEYKVYDNSDKYATIEPDRVLDHLELGRIVRLKPKPVRRLKRASVILDEAFERGAVVYHDQGHKIMIVTGGKLVSLGWLHKNQLRTYNELPGTFGDILSWGDWMFESVETPATPSMERIEEMAASVAYRYAPADTASQRVLREQLARLIREGCSARNIT